MRLFRPLLDLLYPRRCPLCGMPGADEGAHVCWDCMARMPILQLPFCRVCGDPVEGMVDHEFSCSSCARRPPFFDRARSAARFRDGLRDCLHAFKYGGDTHLSRDLSRLMVACVNAQYEDVGFDAAVCVPLYPSRERDRSYNQAALLASHVAADLALEAFPRCLVRVRSTKTQTSLSASERRANVRNAFQIRYPGWVEGRRLLLVDDVMTTGATVNECSRILKKAGAASVYVVTVARG